MHVSFLCIANFLVTVFVKSERTLLEQIWIAWLHQRYLIFWKNSLKNTPFGTTELCKYCVLDNLNLKTLIVENIFENSHLINIFSNNHIDVTLLSVKKVVEPQCVYFYVNPQITRRHDPMRALTFHVCSLWMVIFRCF